MAASIAISETGFVVVGKQSEAMNWNEIDRIDVFKLDLFTWDLICFALYRRDGSWIELSEEMDGYREFLYELASRFDLSPGWWTDVAFPAFAENLATIWSSE